MGFEFLKQHGAQRTTGRDNPRNPFSNMQTGQLKEFLASYEQMTSSGKTLTGTTLSAHETETMKREIEKMRGELSRRKAW